MGMAWPKIISRRTTRLSPWVEIIEREVEFKPGASAETYHAIGQQDYVAVVARTPDGMIPIVRQFRPAVEGFTWELPASRSKLQRLAPWGSNVQLLGFRT